MHGARLAHNIKRGTAHPNYKHGRETQGAKAERSRSLAKIEDIGADILRTWACNRAKVAGQETEGVGEPL
ncbi:hypothetical protein GCM10023115_18150 [Pontixanthobacter gangjinensis]